MVTPNRQQVVGSDAAIVEPVARETASWTRIPPRGLPDDVSNGQLISPDGNLALNVFPAHFSADAVEVFVGPHGGDEVYDALVAAEDGWSAWRDTDDGARVYVWRHRDNVRFARPEFRRASVSLEESPRLFSHLMLAGIDRQLEELGFARGQRDHPGPAVYTKWGTGNFLSGLGIDGFEPDLRVGIFPKIIVESLITRFGDASPSVYLIVDVAYTSILDIPVHELLTQKFSVIGRYVKLHEGPTATTGTSGRTIGRVSKVSGTELILEDRRDGVKERVAAETCVLEPGRLTIEAYLRHIHPNHYRAAKPALDGRLAMLMSPPEKLRLAEGFVSRRLGTTDEVAIPLAAGLTVKFSDPVTPSADAAPFRASTLNPPTFSFDPESAKHHPSPDGGISKFGPYSQLRMRGPKPRILILAPESYKGQVEQFVNQFRVGISGYQRTFNGFAQKYRLTGIDLIPRYFNGSARQSAAEAYCNATIDALDEDTNYDLCFMIIREDFKRLPVNENPYYLCKAQLLPYGIVVQDVRVETLRQTESMFKWSLNTLGLATYAKLGGVPFVLKARQIEKHELVFGIGSTIERPPGSRLGAMKQIIGFTTVFRSDGDYLLNTCTPYSTFSDYARRLEDVVRKTVEEVAASEGIADGDELRLIFHVYKRTGRREVDAIKNAVAKLTRYKIEFALLHINDSHNFHLFDRINPGSRRHDGSLVENTALIPPRQIMIELGPRERLINLIGPKQYRHRGTPTPLRLTLDRASTYTDLDSLAQQVYDFSFMSYRSFNPGIKPVTIDYPTRMARMNSRLRQASPAWNEELVRTKLKRTLWFI